MRVVGIKVLKNKLSEYVRLAAGGEVVLVADRDQVVAELRPPSPGRADTVADARLAEAARNGWVKPPSPVYELGRPGLVEPLWSTIEEFLEELDASREDRI